MRIKIYAQAHSFAQVATNPNANPNPNSSPTPTPTPNPKPNPNQVSLNTTVLGLGPEKDYGGRVGAPLGTL